MDNAGLIGKFKVNRPLTEQEKQNHLKQKERLTVEPHYQLSVIKLNSTYLESVDKWYGDKGLITAIGLISILLFSGFGFAVVGLMLSKGFSTIRAASTGNDFFFHAAMITLILLPVVGGLIWFLKKESFAFTHYPIRFNRKSRRVHVFQTDGNTFSASWDDVYFTMSQVDSVHKFWNIFGHILDKDRAIVLQTFTLSVSGSGDAEGLYLMKSHWEFVRRYMEDGPKAVNRQVQFCLPISERRESFMFDVHRLLANNSVTSRVLFPLILLSAIFDIITAPFRYFAIRTSKIPQWPISVETDCTIEADDPYAIEGTPSGERKAVFPSAATAAGVKFTAPPRASHK